MSLHKAPTSMIDPTGAVDGQILTYSSANNAWVPTNAPSSGGGGESIPVGSVSWFAGPIPPIGFLECNGSLKDRSGGSGYPDLFAAIGTVFNTGGESGSQFRLPDLRGEFIRGWSNSKPGVDTGRTLGSSQSELFGSHTHPVTDPGHAHNSPTWNRNSGPYEVPSASGPSNYNYDYGTESAPTTTNTTGISIGSTGGTETRPRNVALMPCIKAVQTVSVDALSNYIQKPGNATTNQVLTYNGNNWIAAAPTNSLTNYIQKPGNATTNQVLTYNGNDWIAAAPASTSGGIVAWVHFSGTRNTSGTVDLTNNTNRQIRASANVSSVLRKVTGEYIINFTLPLTDDNYVITASGTYGRDQVGAGGVIVFPNATQSLSYVAPTRTSCTVATNVPGGGTLDAQHVYVSIIR